MTNGNKYVASPQRNFPGAIYRNKTNLMEEFIRTDIAPVELFFNIHLQNWDICHTVGPISYSRVVEVCRLGL